MSKNPREGRMGQRAWHRLVVLAVVAGLVGGAVTNASRDPDGLEPNLPGAGPGRTLEQRQPAKTASAAKDAPFKGSWSTPSPWPVVAINATLLPNGKVLTWGGGRPSGLASLADVWDPGTNTHTSVQNPWTDLFCAGQTLLPDGRVLAAGGHYANSDGSEHTNLFDYRSNTWSRGPNMKAGRWYPTVLALPDGQALIAGGHDRAARSAKQPVVPNWLPEVFDGSSLRALPNASQPVNWYYYPWLQVAPDGKPVVTGPLPDLATLELNAKPGWRPSGQRDRQERKYGNSVMFAPGKVLVVGGGQNQAATNTAVIVDLADSSRPKVTPTGSMRYTRLYQNSVILPNGHVLAVGGQSRFYNGDKNPVLTSESWDPATGLWTVRAAQRVMRMYHSTALLLPDGRVLSTGGGAGGKFSPKYSAELYTPWYLFRRNAKAELASRPLIKEAPQLVGYGERFPLRVQTTSPIRRLTLVRLGATTHAFDGNQRFVELSFSSETQALMVNAPAHPNLVPPGQYMLFALDQEGVPSVAKIITIQGQAAPEESSFIPIFEDALAEGWQGQSWDSSITLENRAPVKSGPAAIAVTHEQGWGGFSVGIEPPLEARSLGALSFSGYGGAGGTALEVYVQESPGAEARAIKRLSLPAGTWTKFRVPLEELGSPERIARLTFQEGTGVPQPTYYLDEIRLIERSGFTANAKPSGDRASGTH